jgi:UDP-galactopyranose mutase
MDFDCIVIGSGFCGSVVARKMAEQEKKVLLIERRSHMAGNMYDEIDSNGIRVHRYGPHTFHTNNKSIYKFITKYDVWFNYKLHCAVDVDGIITPSPFNFKTIDQLYNGNADTLKQRLKTQYPLQKSVTILKLLDSGDTFIKAYAEKLFEMDYRPYTAKQWGIPPEAIDPSVLERVPVRLDYTDAYFDDTYQCMPKDGYTGFFKKLLSHKNITVQLNTDALKIIKISVGQNKIYFGNKLITIPVVYTGAIDELLEYKYGRLPYRSLRFDYQTKNTMSFQGAPVTAHPGAKGYTRITEYKKLPVQNVPDVTTVAYEYPLQADSRENYVCEPYYPVLTKGNIAAYEQYRLDLAGVPNLFLCGRLADYKYYNMDAAVVRAFSVMKEINIFLKRCKL